VSTLPGRDPSAVVIAEEPRVKKTTVKTAASKAPGARAKPKPAKPAAKATKAASKPAGKKPAAGTAKRATAGRARRPVPAKRVFEKVLKVSLHAPEAAVIQRAAEVLTAGGLVAFPTDTLYAVGAILGNAAAAERIKRLRGIDTVKRPFTLLLPDVGTLPHYAKVSESAYRIINRIMPGPYCVELAAGPKVLGAPGFTERETLGLRIPDSAVCAKLMWRLGRPIVSATAKSQGGATLTMAEEIVAAYGDEIDLVLDGGVQTGLPSTVISLVDDWITILRAGRGSTANIL
jgi:tRNA threonylcarbamoyl adenosine modification protein (Sua5/YciO/YrdC/YwlC family)